MFGRWWKTLLANVPKDPSSYPTMADLTPITLWDDEGEDLSEVEFDDGLDEEYEMIQAVDENGQEIEFGIVGDVWYQESQYLVCIPRDHLSAYERREIEGGLPVLIFQTIPGVGGSHMIFYPIEQQALHDAVYEAFLEEEMDRDL